jgi:hypothetical protein
VTRSRGKLVACSVAVTVAVAITGAVVFADLAPSPEISVVTETSTTGSGHVMVTNTGASTASVASVTPSGTCSSNVSYLSPPSFSLGSGLMQTLVYTCPFTSGTYGIFTCTYDLRDSSSNTLGSFEAVCADSNGDGSGNGGSNYLEADNPSIDFEVAADGAPAMATSMITNVGTAPMSVSLQLGGADANVFSFVSPCGGTQGCSFSTKGLGTPTQSIEVQCAPSAAGTYSATLYAVTDTGASMNGVVLTCTREAGSGDEPALQLSGSNLDFGGVERTSMGSSTRTLTMKNTGNASLAISDVVLDQSSLPMTPFTFALQAPCANQTTCTLAPMDTVDVKLTYEPTGFGSQSALLEITSNDPNNSGSAQVTLVGTGNGATMSLASNLGSPPTLDFGTILVNGSAAPQSFSLQNDGNEAAMVDLAGVTAPFQAPDTIMLQPGSNEVDVTCSPTMAGTFMLTLTVKASLGTLLYPNNNSPVTITLACIGSTGELLAAPPSVDLKEVRTGTSTQLIHFMLTTTDTSPVTLSPPMLVGSNGAAIPTELSVGGYDNGDNTLTNGSAVGFDLTVTPGSGMDTSLAAGIVVMSTNDAHTITIPIKGSLAHASASVPAAVNLGVFCVNTAPVPIMTSLHNAGTATLGLPMPPALGSATSPFSLALVSPTTYPAPLEAGSSATVSISAPSQVTAGTLTDTLGWSTDIAGMTAISTPVSITFAAGGGGVQPGSIDFGQVQVNTTAATRMVTIKNCGTTDLPLGAISVAPPFTTGALPERSIPSQGSATLAVGFQPTMAGTYDSTLSISSMPMDLTVALHGTAPAGSGSSGGDDEGPTRASLYACGCRGGGDPSGTAAILIAIVAIVVPRRRR